MAECDFSWFKICSFFGALVLVFLCFMLLGFGISNMVDGEAAYGVACVIAGIICGGAAVKVYINYQKKRNYGKD